MKRNKKSRIRSRTDFLSNFFKRVGSCFRRCVERIRYKFVVVGTVDYVSQRFAYVIASDKKVGDVFIVARDMNFAINEDVVRVGVLGEKKYGHYRGKILNIIRHAKTTFVGDLKSNGKKGFLVNVSDRKFFWPISIDSSQVSSLNFDNDTFYKVKVKLTDYPENEYTFKGNIVEIFGKVGEHETEMKSIINEYGLPERFCSKVADFVDKKPFDENVLRGRRDFRSDFTVTIDPLTAKDFDDAISIKSLDNGHYEVGVHIADVSYFVEDGSPVDVEAYKRNTSVYLIDRVIPMLPEVLCNDLCSLLPNEDRLTMSIVFEMDMDGEVYNQWIGEGVIRSDKRLTYDEAQNIIDDSTHELHKNIDILFQISKALREKRFLHGAINFEFEDVNFGVNEDLSLNISKTDLLDSHHLVEEFMLLANKNIAMYAYKMCNENKKKYPCFLYRVHESPEKSKVVAFAILVKQFGFILDEDIDRLPFSVNKIIEQVKGKPEENVILTSAVRMMPKAIYSTEPKQHFGLAFEHYTHFTSPIRRYPDVLVHRMIKKMLNNVPIIDVNKLSEACTYAGEREQLATDAERESIRFKQVEFVKNNYLGQRLIGIITGVAEWGIFVELTDSKCEGLIRFSEYKYDTFILDRSRIKVVGRYTGNRYCIGDQIDVIVKKCNVENRTVDLSFVC